MNTQDQNAEQGKEAKKVLEGFNQTVKKLTAIVKGDENLKPVRKVKLSNNDGDDTYDLVKELFAEESAATKQEVKEGLKTLLKGYVALNNSLTEERKKLDALEVAKKKEFNQSAAKLFAKIEGVDSLTKEYYTAFQAAEEAVVESTEEETEE
jgi:hypothetical protein